MMVTVSLPASQIHRCYVLRSHLALLLKSGHLVSWLVTYLEDGLFYKMEFNTHSFSVQ